jgi:hypothetical protein
MVLTRIKKSGLLAGKRTTEIPYLSCGFGDGIYSVHKLMFLSSVAGLEVEFIAPNTKYPF